MYFDASVYSCKRRTCTPACADIGDIGVYVRLSDECVRRHFHRPSLQTKCSTPDTQEPANLLVCRAHLLGLESIQRNTLARCLYETARPLDLKDRAVGRFAFCQERLIARRISWVALLVEKWA